MSIEKLRVGSRSRSIVIMKNDLIRGNYKGMNTNDVKILKLLISKVYSKDSLFKEYYIISNKEVKDKLGFKSGNIGKIIKDSLKVLGNVYIEIENSDNRFLEVGILKNKIDYDKNKGKYLVEFNEEIGDYLLNVFDNFSSYDLENISFLSKKEIKLYEYLRLISYDQFEVNVEKLIRIMELGDSYKKIFNFKKVFKKSVEKINMFCDVKIIEYDFIKNIDDDFKVWLVIERKKKEYSVLDSLNRLKGKNISYNDTVFRVLDIETSKEDGIDLVTLRVFDMNVEVVATLKRKDNLKGSLDYFSGLVVESNLIDFEKKIK